MNTFEPSSGTWEESPTKDEGRLGTREESVAGVSYASDAGTGVAQRWSTEGEGKGASRADLERGQQHVQHDGALQAAAVRGRELQAQ